MTTNILTPEPAAGYAPRLSRRDLLKRAGGAAVALVAGGAAVAAVKPAAAGPKPITAKLRRHLRLAVEGAWVAREELGIPQGQRATLEDTRRLAASLGERFRIHSLPAGHPSYGSFPAPDTYRLRLPEGLPAAEEATELAYYVGAFRFTGPHSGMDQGATGLLDRDAIAAIFAVVWLGGFA